MERVYFFLWKNGICFCTANLHCSLLYFSSLCGWHTTFTNKQIFVRKSEKRIVEKQSGICETETNKKIGNWKSINFNFVLINFKRARRKTITIYMLIIISISIYFNHLLISLEPFTQYPSIQLFVPIQRNHRTDKINSDFSFYYSVFVLLYAKNQQKFIVIALFAVKKP